MPKKTAATKTDKPTATTSLVGKPLNLLGLIDYQPGSVVSRQIVKKKVGTVTVFAFDAGEGLSEHTAPFDALVSVLDGEAEITIEDKLHCVAAGEIIILPANKPHAVAAKVRFKMLLTMIRA